MLMTCLWGFIYRKSFTGCCMYYLCIFFLFLQQVSCRLLPVWDADVSRDLSSSATHLLHLLLLDRPPLLPPLLLLLSLPPPPPILPFDEMFSML